MNMQIPTLDYTQLSRRQESAWANHLHKHNLSYTIGICIGLFVVYLGLISELSAGVKFALGLTAVLLIIWAMYLFNFWRRENERQKERYALFATRNNLTMQTDKKDFLHEGVLFGAVYQKKVTLSFSVPTEGSPIEIGNYTYTIGHGKNSETLHVGYLHTKLPRKLPHLLLDATANNKRWSSNLPHAFQKSQILSLEGDFDKYFSLYVPKQYERDALYILTPDVMATLIDHAQQYDIEIIDDDMYLYSNTAFSLSNEESWRTILSLVSAISPQFETQTDYYADERVYDRTQNKIAHQGRRLKQGFQVTAAAAAIVIVILQFTPILAGGLGLDSDTFGVLFIFSFIGVLGLLTYKIFKDM